MPELPEVEFAARRLRIWTADRRITAADAEPGTPLRDLTPAQLIAGLRGRRVEAIHRIGKQLLIDLEGQATVLLHLGMTGKLLRRAADEAPRQGRRLWLTLDDGHRLDLLDPRRFGRVRLLPTAAALAHPEVARLGPDALALCADPAAFADRIRRTRRPIKLALLDQSLLAGVGNIYAAEGLFFAGLAPGRLAASLTAAEAEALAAGLLRTMTESLVRERDDEIRYLQDARAANPFQIYGREGRPCPRCAGPIARAVQGQRSTFWCPRCQPG